MTWRYTNLFECSLAVVLNGKQTLIDALHKQSEVFADRPDIWTESNIFNIERKGMLWDFNLWQLEVTQQMI